MKMRKNEILNEFSSRIIELVSQMKTYSEEMPNKRIVEKF